MITHVHCDSDGGQVKEVFVRFGLAIYDAQVLEHGIVNPLFIHDVIACFEKKIQATLARVWGES